MPTVEEVISKYVELRDREAEIAKRHAEELAPLSEAKGKIEAWLLAQANATGVDSFKTPAGTAYKKITTSVKLSDAEAFRKAVFLPVIEELSRYASQDVVEKTILSNALWDMVDFRAGKKGILEYKDTYDALPPGVAYDEYATINVRRG